MAEFTKPDGAPDEVVTKAFHREVDLTLFGFKGTLSLITLDNGLDHNRPNTLGPQSLQEIDSAITLAEGSASSAIAITGKPFIFAAGADLSALPFVSKKEQALAIGKYGHDVFKRLGRSKKPTFAFINGLALGGGLEIGLHCNYRTLASTAFTALPECFLGIVPGWGGATLLPKLIGSEKAVQVIILNALNNNTMMKAKDALGLGVGQRRRHALRGVQHHEQAREIDLAERHADWRHEHAVDHRGDNLAERRADHDAHGKVQDAAAADELLE